MNKPGSINKRIDQLGWSALFSSGEQQRGDTQRYGPRAESFRNSVRYRVRKKITTIAWPGAMLRAAECSNSEIIAENNYK